MSLLSFGMYQHQHQSRSWASWSAKDCPGPNFNGFRVTVDPGSRNVLVEEINEQLNHDKTLSFEPQNTAFRRSFATLQPNAPNLTECLQMIT
jgi:hypothetical protein